MALLRSRAVTFVVLIGIVSLFADMTYEGARSANGPFLALLGASGAAVGIVAGFGELIGYALRLVSGWVSDKTQAYWPITIFGYAVNLLAVPALALAGNWKVAAALMIAERAGKAIRNPAKDAMLSHATYEMGHGWGFGLHEALDQIGAMTGPLIVSVVLYFKKGYAAGYAVLLVPALLAIAVLLFSYFLYPNPRDFETSPPPLQTKGFSRHFWIYVLAASLVAAGFADFPLIAFHFEKVSKIPEEWIPAIYSLAMGVDAVAALVLGRWFDRVGIRLLAGVAFASAFFAPLVFYGGIAASLAGMALWGVGMGAQESLMRAAVAGLVSKDKRATAYGLFNFGYGIFWFLGSALMGLLYDHSIAALVVFSVAVQLASVPLFVWRQ
jgi:MFS family permease